MRVKNWVVTSAILLAGCAEEAGPRAAPRDAECSAFDLDRDGEVGFGDFLLLQANFGGEYEGQEIDFEFFLEFADWFGKACEPPTDDVEEHRALVIGPPQEALEQELLAVGLHPTFTGDGSTYAGLPAPYGFDVAILLPTQGDMPEVGQFRLTRHVEAGGAFIGFADTATRFAAGQFQGLGELVLLEDPSSAPCGESVLSFAEDVDADANARELAIAGVSACGVGVRRPDDIEPVRTLIGGEAGVYMAARAIDTGAVVNFSADPSRPNDWANVAMTAGMLGCSARGELTGASPSGDWVGETVDAAQGGASCSTCGLGSRSAPEALRLVITQVQFEHSGGGDEMRVYGDVDVPMGRDAVVRLKIDDGGFHSDGPHQFFAGRPEGFLEKTDPPYLIEQDKRWEWHEQIEADAKARVFETGRYRHVLLTVINTGVWDGPDCGFLYDTSEGERVDWDNSCVDWDSHPDEKVYTVHPPVLWAPDAEYEETVWGKHYLTADLVDITEWQDPYWRPEIVPAFNSVNPEGGVGKAVVIEHDVDPPFVEPDPFEPRPYPYRWPFDTGVLTNEDPFAAAGRLAWNAPMPMADFVDAEGGPDTDPQIPDQSVGEIRVEFYGTVGRGWREDDGTYTPLPNDAKYLLRHLQNKLRGIHDIGIPEKTMRRLSRDGIVKYHQGPSKRVYVSAGMSGASAVIPGKSYYILEVGKNNSDRKDGCDAGESPCPERRLLFVRKAVEVDSGRRGFLSWFEAKKYRYVYEYKRSAYTRHKFGLPSELIALHEEGVAAQNVLTQATTQHAAAHLAIEFIPTAKFWGQWVDDEVEYTGFDMASDALFLVGGAGEVMKAINVAGKSGRWVPVLTRAQKAGAPIEFAAGAGEVGVGAWEAGKGLAAANNNTERAFAVASGLLPAGGLGITYLKLSKVPGTRSLLTRTPGLKKLLGGIEEWEPEGIKVLEHIEGGIMEGIWVVEHDGVKYAMKLPDLGDNPAARRAEIWEAINDIQQGTSGLKHGNTNALGVIEHLDRSQLDVPEGLELPEGDLIAFFDPLYPIDETDCFSKFVELEGEWGARSFEEMARTKFITEDAMEEMVAQLNGIAGEVHWDGSVHTITRMSHRDPNTTNLLFQMQKETRKVELDIVDVDGPRTVTQEVEVVIDVHVAAIDYHGPPNLPNWEALLVDKIAAKDNWVSSTQATAVRVDDDGFALLDAPLDVDPD